MISLIYNTPASMAAAKHLLNSPPLCYSPFVDVSPMRAINAEPVLQVRVDDSKPFSSGESECLLPLLESLSTMGSFFDLQSLKRLDVDTRMTACQAVLLYAGVISEVVATP